MKLKTLKAAGFGALRELEFEFGGESSVVLGPNESGKTALVDAISCALYGPPRTNSPLGRLFSARYGEKVSASAYLLQSDGSALEVSAELPLQADSHPYELFRSLLVIREGECRLPDRDKRFLEAFSEKVLGAGSVDINEAMKAVRRVYSPDERHRWSHLRTELQQAAAKAAAAQLEAAEMELTAEKKRELNEKLSRLDSRMTELEQLRRRLEAASDSQRLEKLKRAQAELATTERQLKELEGLDRSFYTRLNLLQAELTSSEKSMAEKQALATRLAKTIAENIKEQSATDKRLSELGGTGRRPRLKGACLELFRLQAELQKLSSGRNFLRFAPSAAALCAGFLAVLLLAKHDAPTTLGAAALAAAAIYFLTLKLLPGDKQRLALAALLDAAQEEFETARAAFGAAWAELDPEAALAWLEEDAAEEARLLERRDMTEKILSRAEGEKMEEEEKLAELKRKAGLLQMQLAADLKRYGAADVSELLAKIEKLDNLHRTREELRRSARSEAELNAATFDADLEQRIRELQRRVDDAAPEAAERAVSPAQAAEQSARARAELKKLGLEREALNRELLAESESLARLEGALGMPAAEIYLAARESQARLDDLELWRRAAEEAFQLLSGLANAGEETLKNCVENAGPVFAAMTEGRYSGLKLDSRSPFEQGGLSALHASLGEKPLEWLSAGAQDLVWLSMRIVFASSGWRTPSFMVLDEPFAALDPRRAAQALTALTRGPLAGWQIILLTKSVELAALCSAGGLKPFSLSRNDDAPENK